VDEVVRAQKPFSQRVLVQRVKVVLRRSCGRDGTVPKEAEGETTIIMVAVLKGSFFVKLSLWLPALDLWTTPRRRRAGLATGAGFGGRPSAAPSPPASPEPPSRPPMPVR
jgi:hypothetical protein